MAPNGASHGSYTDPKWWKEATVYQIYPASFLSTASGSVPGWGDIKGITSKVDYIKDLGADLIWLSPIYKSPQADMGYDIADYKDIDERYGTLADVDELIAKLKSRGMKLMMDLVVNHTSNQHPWFLDSRSSKSSSKRDWYIWQPPKYDENGNRQPPNNWQQILGTANSAWEWDEETQEYYLCIFTPEQPDLNWRNPDVREAVHDVLRFWLERGVSGFRMDVINMISKVEGYPMAPITLPGEKYQPGHMFYANGPHLHEYLQDMRKEVLDHFDTITVGEMPCVNEEEEILKIVDPTRGELNMIFIFDIVDIDNSNTRMSLKEWAPGDLRNIVSRWQRVMAEGNGWNSIFIENHDNPRSVSRYTDDSDEFRELGSKLLCLMLTTLGGTLYVFQGQELGQRNMPSSFGPEEYKDIETLNFWKMVQDKNPNDEEALAYGKKIMQLKARDHSRTPVQWNNLANAGFCTPNVEPWMRVNTDSKTVNAAAQRQDTSGLSVFQFWRAALQRRKNFKDVFVYGAFECVDENTETVFAYKRASENGEWWLVVLNFVGKAVEWQMPKEVKIHWFAESTYGDDLSDAKRFSESGKVKLRAWEGLLARVPAEVLN